MLGGLTHSAQEVCRLNSNILALLKAVAISGSTATAAQSTPCTNSGTGDARLPNGAGAAGPPVGIGTDSWAAMLVYTACTVCVIGFAGVSTHIVALTPLTAVVAVSSIARIGRADNGRCPPRAAGPTAPLVCHLLQLQTRQDERGVATGPGLKRARGNFLDDPHRFRLVSAEQEERRHHLAHLHALEVGQLHDEYLVRHLGKL